MSQAHPGGQLELWGGIEPTLNRVGDRYYSQLDRSGHHARLDDLDSCAGLGIRALRYPVLWERTMPLAGEAPDWRWSDERLHRLRQLGIRVIVGLVHHGSGPPHTHLLDPAFASQLGRYAGLVAARYPWVEDYTPVNEPLTTAIFSGLYGIWYPHARSDRAFTTALLTQCRAIVLAMRAIRRVNPSARLVQTEDLGKTYSTPLLQYQADFNNERRWLAWDLLSGRVDRDHPLSDWLLHRGGASASDLVWFRDNACPPDVIGINHYITSERFISEEIERFPPQFHGTNGRHRYADMEAARCLAQPTAGLGPLIEAAWQRYRTAIAVTEAHIDATREDQMRWIAEIWCAAEAARGSGADVRAVTLWALFGIYDWNCLVAQCRGYYEPGAFDVRSTPPRPTALAELAKCLAAGTLPDHTVLSKGGWWLRPGRHFCRPVTHEAGCETRASRSNRQSRGTILVTGAHGTLGRAFGRVCEQRGLDYRLLARCELDIADPDSVAAAFAEHEPWAVVNTAGYVRVDDAERNAQACHRDNAHGAQVLASQCALDAVQLVTFSSDLVFDGTQSEPYLEGARPAPLNVYGRSKAQAESWVLERHPAALVVRTSAFFGPWDEHNHITSALRALAAGQAFPAATDLVVSPTYVPDLVNVCLDLLIDRASGIWHLSNVGAVTWAELAVNGARAVGIDAESLVRCTAHDLGLAAPRPRYSVLGSERAALMPTLADALERYAALCAEQFRPRAEAAVQVREAAHS